MDEWWRTVLVVTTIWNLVLLWMNYPREDWIGVVAVGYVSVWIARAIITYPIGRIMEYLHHRIKTLAKSQGVDLPEHPISMRALPPKVQLRIISFGIPMICVFMAVSVILTDAIIGFASLAPLTPGAMPIAIIVAVVGTVITAGHVCNMYFTLSKLQRQLNPEKIHRNGEYVDGLGQLAVAMGM